MRLVSVKSEQNRVIQWRRDTENMRYYQEGRPFFRQNRLPSNPDRSIRLYRWFQDSRRVASSTFASHTKFAILNIQISKQKGSAGRDL